MSRYRKPQSYIANSGDRPKQVFFLTATPINNSVHDFRNILAPATGENLAYFLAKAHENLWRSQLTELFQQLREGIQ